ncbi:hypothetical protein BDV36DRAFT_211493 [Aspergillus pseudocaelatus]|uniref:Uncharacterized protein n=1 Tax=Aspergillus pseudocaelatus TaxID=1825620 RepID=A0ABQ6X031_9EURO|nr:hypothetical protein BDV36DRAFT_211493 [Aspergillus pseudocaelatus]
MVGPPRAIGFLLPLPIFQTLAIFSTHIQVGLAIHIPSICIPSPSSLFPPPLMSDDCFKCCSDVREKLLEWLCSSWHYIVLNCFIYIKPFS